MDEEHIHREARIFAEQRKEFGPWAIQSGLRVSYMQAMRCIDRMMDDGKIEMVRIDGRFQGYKWVAPNAEAQFLNEMK